MLVSNPFSDAVARDVEAVSRDWWLVLLNGLVSIVAGGIILAVDWSLSDLAVFIGAFFIARGFLTTFSLPVDGSSRGWAVFMGLVEVAVGIAVWAWPEPSLLVVALWIGWYVLFRGIVTISGSISARDVIPDWGLLLAYGILESLLALYLISQPGLTLVATIFAVGIWAIVYGVVQTVVAFDLRHLGSRAARFTQPLSRAPRPGVGSVAS